jgi:AraC-like DNA-binding protein
LGNYYITESTSSTDVFSKSLETLITGSTIKSRAVLNRFTSTGDGIISDNFYIGNNFTEHLIDIEVQNSASCILSMPKVGSYTTRVSNRSSYNFSKESGGIVLPADNVLYKAISGVVNDLIIIIDMDYLIPVLEKKYNIKSFEKKYIKLDAKREKVASIRSFIESTLQSARSFPHVRESLLLKTNIKEITSLFVADLIADSLKISPISNNSSSAVLVRRAEELIDNECDSVFTIREIANKLYTTPRTLQIAFKRHRKYSPMQFLKNRKLTRAHKLLISQNDSNFTVKRAALSAGILDLNRFSKYYKEMFGELPSTTIKNDE